MSYLHFDCAECARLWEQFLRATQEELHFECKLRTARQRISSGHLRVLEPLADIARDECAMWREKIIQHEDQSHSRVGTWVQVQ